MFRNCRLCEVADGIPGDYRQKEVESPSLSAMDFAQLEVSARRGPMRMTWNETGRPYAYGLQTEG